MAPKHYLSVCATYFNEAPYLREWIEFHRLVGIEHFYLYNNRSTDNHAEVLAPFVEEGLVDVHDWDLFPGQLQAYDDCLERHGEESRWIAYIDCDEFLFSPLGRPLPEIIGEFEDFPGVAVHWAVFGYSGHETQPPGLVIENYLMRADDERNYPVKCIVDPAKTVRCGKIPHYFEYVNDALIVNENHELLKPVPGGHPWPHIGYDLAWDRLRLNHYVTKSKEERARKLARPVAFNGKMKNAEKVMVRDLEIDQVRDETILMYLPALKEALARLPDPAGHSQ
jgi:hypothetical protein